MYKRPRVTLKGYLREVSELIRNQQETVGCRKERSGLRYIKNKFVFFYTVVKSQSKIILYTYTECVPVPK
jgi:hypothetical protein